MAALLMQGANVLAESMDNRQIGVSLPTSYIQNPNDSISMIENKVKEAVAQHLEIEMGSVNLDADLVKDLGADSLDVVEIVIRLEKEFGFEFSDDELNGLKKVGDLVTVIEKRKK